MCYECLYHSPIVVLTHPTPSRSLPCTIISTIIFP
uniref:Uncharacterized protein n=1 Tax=Anguilla anguilla TaxID=7936 RepID=A0A0E9RKI1_ANGAN